MEAKIINKWIWLVLVVLIAGCAPKKPADTSDPQASMAWLDYSLDASEQKPTEVRQLYRIYGHAAELEGAHAQNVAVTSFVEKNKRRIGRIPEKICRMSISSGDFESFEWALKEDQTIAMRYDELIAIWKQGAQWRKIALESFPEALPVFMSQAIDARNTAFFDANVSDFKATGYKVKSPLLKSEFMSRYLTYIGYEAERAVNRKDNDRIKFLIGHTPVFEETVLLRPATSKQLQALGKYVLYEIRDDQLTARWFGLGFGVDNLDLEKIDMKSSFAKTLKANPENAVRMVGLDKPGGAIGKTAARFLLQFPVHELKNLHPQHIDEAIELCMQAGGNDAAIKFIQLKDSVKPLDHEDYIRLMTLGLKYNSGEIYGLAKKGGGSISITELDIAELAYNQSVFERNASKFMVNIHDTMDDERRSDGITLGTIYRIFESENEKAGLWVVKKYDLEEKWLAASGDVTLLMDVCRSGNLQAARYLIEKSKMDLHATTRYSGNETSLFGTARSKEGRLSAIFFAAQSGNPELIKYLNSKGANVNARSNYGATPLMFAASAGQLEAVKTLIALGAQVNSEMHEANRNDIFEDGKGYNQLSTALNRSRAYGYPEITALLEEKGAK